VQLLLDTCTFLWIISDSAELSEVARAEIRSPENAVFLSSVSAWEIAVKSKLGKLPLPEAAAQFVPTQRALHRIEPLALDERAVLTLAKLPELHKDPFDRMLICQAIASGMTLVTPDPLVSQYPVSLLW
jgi:PIN domain nuclease of toxin-antitoxin system